MSHLLHRRAPLSAGFGMDDASRARRGGGGIGARRGRGGGRFEAAETIANLSKPMALVCADLDGDGALDIAAACIDSACESPTELGCNDGLVLVRGRGRGSDGGDGDDATAESDDTAIPARTPWYHSPVTIGETGPNLDHVELAPNLTVCARGRERNATTTPGLACVVARGHVRSTVVPPPEARPRSNQVNGMCAAAIRYWVRGKIVPDAAGLVTRRCAPCPSPSPTATAHPTISAVPLPAPTTVPLPAPTTVPLPTTTAVPLPAPTTVPLPAPTTVSLPAPTTVPLPAPTTVPHRERPPRCGPRLPD